MSTAAKLKAEPASHAPLPPVAPSMVGWDLVTASNTYVGDVRPAGMLHLAIARSTHAHARVTRLDLSAARAAEGVVDAFGPEEVAELSEPVRPALDPETIGGHRTDQRALVAGIVRYVGEPIAVVVATSRRAARNAAARVEASYEPLPAVMTGAQAVEPAAPVLYPEHGMEDNVLAGPRVTRGDAAKALEEAEFTASATIQIQRSTAAPLEPRGYVATWDEQRDPKTPRADYRSEGVGDRRLTVHASHQHPFQLRTMLARTLRMKEDQVRVVVPSVGGSFGLKMTGGPEEVLICLAALRTGRPVGWTESREECFLGGAREQTHRIDVGFDADGRVRALRDEILVPVGAVSASPGWRMGYVSAVSMPSGYDVDHVEVAARLVLTNMPPWSSARGWGKEAPVLVMEHILDLVADHTGLDPEVVRERNLVTPDAIPYRMASGYVIDSGDFAAVLRASIELADLTTLRAIVASRESVRDLESIGGIGLAFELTPEGGGHPAGPVGPSAPPVEAAAESARVDLGPDGRVAVFTGMTSPGGGNETAIAQLVAHELGIDRDAVSVVQGDTDLCPPGTGNASSRGAAVGGAAAVLAVRAVIRQCTAALASAQGIDLTDVRLIGDRWYAGEVLLGDLAQIGAKLHRVDPDATTAVVSYRPTSAESNPSDGARRDGYPYFSSGAYVAHVDLDPLTGLVRVLGMWAVHDCGTVIDETLIGGQLHGAMAMGIGLALHEELLIQDEGDLATRTFKQYLVPRANDVPRFRVGHYCTPSPRTLLGAKGGGEAGLGGAQAAVANAVADAVRRHTGVRPRDLTLPLSPPRVMDLLDRAAHEEAP